jgi:hypothetical protein
MDVTLGHAVDELSRPIDAIRHQAKTVTVGTSRKEHLPEGIIFDFLKTLNISTKSLTSNNIIAIRGLQKAVRDIRGYTLYRVANLDADGTPADYNYCYRKKRRDFPGNAIPGGNFSHSDGNEENDCPDRTTLRGAGKIR